MNVLKLAPTRALLAFVAVLALAPVSAFAQQPAPRYIDETEMQVQLLSQSGANNAGAYHLRVSGTVYERIGASDAIRVDVKAGNRTIATRRCEFGDARDDDGGAGRLDCTLEETDLTAMGPVQVDLVYMDDQDSSATIIRTLKLRVVRYWSWEGMNGTRPTHRAHYQVAGDDLLGAAYGYHVSANEELNRGRGQMKFYFWTSAGRSGARNLPANLNNASFRCSVNGTRLRDLEGGLQSNGSSYDVDNRVFTNHAPQDADVEHWEWTRVVMRPYGMWWGSHADATHRNLDTEPDAARNIIMGDHPGAWVCDVRASGRVVRQFRFNVGADGRIAQHPELEGAGAMRVVPGVVMVDLRFGTPNDFDFSFQPAAIRASAPFGRPWTHPEAVADMLGALPPAVGSSDPAVVPAGQSRTPAAAAARGGRRGRR